MSITREMLIYDVLREYPETNVIFLKYKMGCVECMGAAAESIERGVLMHGLDIKVILKELNGISGSKQ